MWWRYVISALVFILLVPGVVVTLPSTKSKQTTILIVHALLFVVALYFAMKLYSSESFGNHGPAGCPAGYTESEDQSGERCVPVPVSRVGPHIIEKA